MNSIEAKRKEDLIVKEAMKQLDYIGVERQRMEDLLYSIVYKSVEMARKEFIDKCMEWDKSCVLCDVAYFKELKQSLEEKK